MKGPTASSDVRLEFGDRRRIPGLLATLARDLRTRILRGRVSPHGAWLELSLEGRPDRVAGAVGRLGRLHAGADGVTLATFSPTPTLSPAAGGPPGPSAAPLRLLSAKSIG
jgi:hypothetical protein